MFLSFLKKYKFQNISEERFYQLKEHAQKYQIPITDFYCWDIALTHISFSENTNAISYERLEFLGDSVLGLCLASIFFENYPDLSEGKMSMLKSNLANEQTLAMVGKKLGLLEVVKLGKGEKLNDRRAQEKVLCDLFESTLAVIFLNHNFNKSREFVNDVFLEYMNKVFTDGIKDFKTKLQKIAVKTYKEYPSYTVVDTEGPDHGKIFTVEGKVGLFNAVGKGRSKKEAEQVVAEYILNKMEEYIQKDSDSILAKKWFNDK